MYIVNVEEYKTSPAFSRRPEIVYEIHPILNFSTNVEYVDEQHSMIKLNQKSQLWWNGECGHTYRTSLSSRLGGSGCPACSTPAKQVIYGHNDLTTAVPEVMKRWNYPKNTANNIHPEDFLKGSSETVWWKGENCKHEWSDPIQKQVAKSNMATGCPLCSGGRKRTIAGVNDLATTHPEVAAEFNTTKNTFKISTVSAGSSKKAWWTCRQGHEIYTPIKNKVKNYCAYCAGQKSTLGINDMATTHAEVAKHFHPTKNGDKTPADFLAKTGQDIWWICDQGHEFNMTGESYSKIHPGCPVCSGHRIEVGYNDAATTHPHMASEWDETSNKLSLNEVTAFSNYRASWKCKKGHLTQSAMYNRAAGKGCAVCGVGNISEAEEALKSYLKEKLPLLDIQSNVRNIIKGELDIYIPEKNIAVEFNGLYWHSEAAGKDKWYHHSKYEACRKQGIQLIQIWEDDWNERKDFIKLALLHKLQEADPALRIGARKLTPAEINYHQAAAFLNENHIQGAVQGTKYYALQTKDSGDIKTVLIVKKVGNKGHEGQWRIERYATSQPVPGGFTKLLKHAEKELKANNETITRWVTFSDNCISDGGLYANNGFTKDAELDPDYMYKVGAKRIHKFNYRLKRFREDPNLKWDEKLSEAELAELNNLPRIWDAGKIRWTRTVN